MASWGWRTKPRSIIRTVQWFKEFGKLEGKNWNNEETYKISIHKNEKIHPIRRIYTYNAHSDENKDLQELTLEQYSSGKFDKKEAEGDARNDKTSFEFFGFGYVSENGIVNTTKVGKLIIENKFDDEDFLKQLLKVSLPNKTYKSSEIGKWKIFPMELILECFKNFDSLNKYEIALLFGCTKKNNVNKTISSIQKFKDNYEKLKNKQKEAEELCIKIYENEYGKMKNKIGSYLDYADAFMRSLIYTGLFSSNGRGNFTKIRISEHSKLKFKLLCEKYKFEENEFNSVDKYMEWFGNPDSIQLPWNNTEARKLLISEKTEYLKNIKDGKNKEFSVTEKSKLKIEQNLEQIKNVLTDAKSDTDIKNIEKDISIFITNINEENYINEIAYTEEARKEILERYELILSNDEMSALWLEVNTWKSLLAIYGEKNIKRNFNIEEDLTPKSFAPGIGNTPDMELYFDDCIILPEVSLMTGVRQWEHEGSSVIDHVFRFINENDDKKVFGLFISSSIHIRTKWQFYILNRESWIGKPVPVIPMTIEMYENVIEFIYKKNIEIDGFINLIIQIHKMSLESENFNSWFDSTNDVINNWKEHFSNINYLHDDIKEMDLKN